MSEENKAIARRVCEIVSTGDFGRTKEIVDSEARAAFPDLNVTVEEVMAEGDRVAARVTMRGTHRGEFQGIAPTGKRVEVRAMDMFRISDGKIVEHWGHADDPSDFLRKPQCS